VTEPAPLLFELRCENCGWIVHALLGGAHGTTIERGRRELIRALHWSRDGHHCTFCRAQGSRIGPLAGPLGCREASCVLSTN